MHPAFGTANALYGLANCYLELLALDGAGAPHPVAQLLASYLSTRSEGLFALALGTDDVATSAQGLRATGLTTTDVAAGEGRDARGAVRRWRSCVLSPSDTRGVSVLAIEHAHGSPLAASPATAATHATVDAVDHVVLSSDDPPAALTLWRDRLGLREAWRREFSERGTVSVGLRLGGVTLELVGPSGAAGAGAAGDRLWGLAYRVGDCDAAVARLRLLGVAVSDPRPGLAPRTRVATVKWPDRVPTLLLQKL
jgi:catechol 2,3-dioxygenase-like lactoylglutathione lyase family enzyme